ncbi:hypothetical protein Ddye_001871 [Dipteronia dyeriana]|uniref:Ubiquitin-like protease family profile domain-containing protein n=1 Tax=Dipteronia dyeriana TaxID=168575 RepID=A0AAE0CTW5_9ROSI|nr:hypothetical protein Ddye_001871 [Dipteronia dyeriana]
MPKDSNDKHWRFPDHNTWVCSRINSNSKGQIIQVVKDVLSKCGMLERFRNGLFGHYLDLPQPVVVHGMLIYNLLKKEIIHPKGREDEIWFGLGQKKVCFGKEQFCVCSGLKMGVMPEVFLKMKPDVEAYFYTKYFKHTPTPEVLESIFAQGTEADGEHLLKMAYILMVCQFFGKDDQMSVIPGWLIVLVDNEQAFTNFPWGTYIFSMTLFSLHSSTKKRLQRLRGKKPYTYNIHGFALAFQVWAIETIPRLTNVVGTRIGSGFPRINNWNFNKKAMKIENKFSSGGISLVNWELDPKELQTDYYKSLVCVENYYTRSKIQTSVPSNIVELYSVMVVLLKECKERITSFYGEKFKESEERITAFCKAEFVSIREEMAALHKVGDTTVASGVAKSDVPFAIDFEMPDFLGNTGVDAKLDESDLPTNFFDVKLENTDVLVEGSREASAQDPNANVAKTTLNAEMEAGVVSDAVAQEPNNDVETTNLNVGEEQPQVLPEHVLFNPTEMDEINHSVLLATQQHVLKVQVQVQGIVVDDYPSPAVNMLVPNSDQSVIALDKADPNVEYKDQDKIRVRKRSRGVKEIEAVHGKPKGRKKISPTQVLIPCNTNGHWVLCQVFLKEGKARYYEQLGIKPRNNAFLAKNIDKSFLPQQADGTNCGVFMLKYAELILSGTSLPWINKFSQNDVPAIREAMALDLLINGVIERLAGLVEEFIFSCAVISLSSSSLHNTSLQYGNIATVVDFMIQTLIMFQSI